MTRTQQFTALTAAAMLSIGALSAKAHCQIPCGIYGDQNRFEDLAEHIRTIEKSMQQITTLGAADAPNYNQIVRWVQNKEVHADAISESVQKYFLAQRIKFNAPDRLTYLKRLEHLHALIVYSMKAKQTTDLENVAKLREHLAAFEASYTGKKAESSGKK